MNLDERDWYVKLAKNNKLDVMTWSASDGRMFTEFLLQKMIKTP